MVPRELLNVLMPFFDLPFTKGHKVLKGSRIQLGKPCARLPCSAVLGFYYHCLPRWEYFAVVFESWLKYNVE